MLLGRWCASTACGAMQPWFVLSVGQPLSEWRVASSSASWNVQHVQQCLHHYESVRLLLSVGQCVASSLQGSQADCWQAGMCFLERSDI